MRGKRGMHAKDLDDEGLVARCLQGDGEAWRHLVQRYQRLVYTIPRRARLPDAAVADVFQVTFARLFEHIGRLTHGDRVRAWIVTTARRETLRQLRIARREVTQDCDWADELAVSTEPMDDPVSEVGDEERWHVVRMTVEKLKPRCRRLIELLFLTEPEASYADISREMDMPIGSIGPTRQRCLAQLRTLMAKTGSGIFD